MSKVFKPNELVRIISSPWKNYVDGVIQIGDIVTIHHIQSSDYYTSARYAVLKELLANYPIHNIGTKHLQSIGLHCNPSRNKREGQYAGWSLLDGKHHRIYHHKKPAGFKSVGTKLLLAIF